ncbi:endonuclease/exonuclease/phosphatase family protein [Bacteroidota bacterium]
MKDAFLRKILLLILLSGIFSNCSNSNTQKKNIPVRIKVLTYNIYHGENMKGRANLDMVSRIIRSVDPDIVALQEVDSCTNRSGGVDIVDVIAKLTNMHHKFGKAMDYDNGAYGVAILSKYPILESVNHLLPASEVNEPRVALEVSIDIPSGERLRFVGTHLDQTRDSQDRMKQANKINDVVLRADDNPVILAGDLNARPGSEAMNIFLQKWIDATDGKAQYNTTIERQRGRIDYIMYYPEYYWKVIEYRVINEKVASDHYPVLVTFELK